MKRKRIGEIENKYARRMALVMFLIMTLPVLIVAFMLDIVTDVGRGLLRACEEVWIRLKRTVGSVVHDSRSCWRG